jgi:hypothetical protein
MRDRAPDILHHLQTVDRLRQAAMADAALKARVLAVKQYQAKRFAHTYADWSAKPDAAPACRFFLNELYGARDFSSRDAQFARIVPAMTRLFPDELVATVQSLSALHALSETMDHAMSMRLPDMAAPTITAASYVQAWQQTGQASRRDEQIDLMFNVGTALSVFTRKPSLRRTLKFMRLPAAAAGLSSLQGFLEQGFDAFANLQDAAAFLRDVASRERTLADRLFALPSDELASLWAVKGDPLGQLP